jgi:hypothetical protein
VTSVTKREELVRQVIDLTEAIRNHQDSVREAARKRRDAILELAKEPGMTDAAIAEMVNMKRSTVEAIRNGRNFGG